MSGLELNPEIFTADYVGEPGRRTFFLQSRSGAGTYTYLVEKDQVNALADELRKLLLVVDGGDTVGRTDPERDPVLGLETPVEPEWRVGAMGLAYDTEADRILITMRGLEPDDEGDAAEVPDVTLSLRRDQARGFVLHALAVVSEGRPVCQLCNRPIDPDGHFCAALNGHRG